MDKETLNYMIEETDNRVYLHKFAHSSDSKTFSFHEDYYLIRNGVVYAIQDYGTEHALYPTGDKLIEYMTCIPKGKYSEEKHKSGKYKRKIGWFDAKSIKPILKKNYHDLK